MLLEHTTTHNIRTHIQSHTHAHTAAVLVVALGLQWPVAVAAGKWPTVVRDLYLALVMRNKYLRLLMRHICESLCYVLTYCLSIYHSYYTVHLPVCISPVCNGLATAVA